MRIIVDVMGGDNAPDAIALGAIEAAKEEKAGRCAGWAWRGYFAVPQNHGIETLPAGGEIANADDVVDMHDDPAGVMKTRKNSSMFVGLQMLKDGGEMRIRLRRLYGRTIDGSNADCQAHQGRAPRRWVRFCLTKTGGAVLIDCGATAECTPEFCCNSRSWDRITQKKMLGVSNPVWRFSTLAQRTRRARSCKKMPMRCSEGSRCRLCKLYWEY